MFIKDYISKDFPCFSLTDSIESARNTLEDFGYSHIFIKKSHHFYGAIAEDFLYEGDGILKDLEHQIERFAILEDNNIMDSIRLFYTFSSNVVPVINKNEKYLGYITCEDIFQNFSRYPLFSETGAILTVEIPARRYSMTEIANIVESNNSKFYGGFITSMSDEMIQITIKISNENLSSIDATFDRYDYRIVQKYYSDEKSDLFNDRFGFFQKFIEI
ncbi:CBS domain-containing protein [Chryseobacterium carnipullorum]|uniref:CBS domain n=1 Tax=Chryseobacterium carnipullorum TaxID=1124835 RepID=A0A1M6ZKQ9_CHRCU|nr:CBS domain-containing protein [Chryseobacterium carnipullorum]MDN5396342.1 CBS domain-containing protein [Chryseobacterium sp.]AZA47805.1 CBS domain-containing protein [Chryseobacterium carnipullorum]AZA67129.1 CBS domain-containing protein [Chryseobacterium carnipullorum]MDN5476625.1 CBS domain-containing protein [Chryseobacterium sp.]SHL31010.1 CBS domain-containing protein [Chryseobacterium carnipullorum]